MKTIVYSVITFCITALLGVYWLQPKVNITYTLSERMPISLLSADPSVPEDIQQIEVRNLGEKKAEKISLKIQAAVTGHHVVPHIGSDTPQFFEKNDTLEVVYPELPPYGVFKLIFKAPVPITLNDLAISHNAGIGTDALATKSTRDIAANVLIWGILISYIGLLFWVIRWAWLDGWKMRLSEMPPGKLISYSKPWFLGQEKWPPLHAEVIKKVVRNEYFYGKNISNSAAYIGLSEKMPGHFDIEEWSEILDAATDKIKGEYSGLANSHRKHDVTVFLKLEKPPSFPDEIWSELRQDACGKYISIREQRFGLDGLEYALMEEKPDGIPEETWSVSTRSLQEKYAENLYSRALLNKDPRQFFEKKRLDLFEEDQRKNLQEKVDNIVLHREAQGLFELLLNEKPIGEDKPSTFKDWHWNKFKEMEKRIARSAKLILVVEILLNKQSVAPEKPEGIGERQWMKLRELEEKMSELRGLEAKYLLLKEGEEKLNKEKATVSGNKQKVLQQLQLIHDLLNDPEAIDRIESYDDTFASGNARNLRKIAETLKSSESMNPVDKN